MSSGCSATSPATLLSPPPSAPTTPPPTGSQNVSPAIRASQPAPILCQMRLLKQAGLRRDLSWFFADWVDADKGLPDLTIQSVFPTAAQAGTWLVAVNVANAGYAAAEVPVTVRTPRAPSPSASRSRPRRRHRRVVMGTPTQVQVNDGTVPETRPASTSPTSTRPPPRRPSRSNSYCVSARCSRAVATSYPATGYQLTANS